MSKKLIAGNWKMNGGLAANEALVKAIVAGMPAQACDVAVCPPALYVPQVQQLLAGQTAVALGAQDVSAHESGAYTGDVAAAMLKEFGVRYAIVGHSERRQYQGERDELVAIKAERLLSAGITPIVCVGETLAQREAGDTEAVVRRQLAAVIHQVGQCVSEIIVAYEPVWAIGTGMVATPQSAQDAARAIRNDLSDTFGTRVGETVRILYGGSVSSKNAVELINEPDVDGFLIGGSALKVDELTRICKLTLETTA